MNHEELKTRTIFLTLAGSHAYGMATATSDVDVRGIAFAPKNALLGLNHFDQAEGKVAPQWMLDLLAVKGVAIPNGDEVDYVVMALAKYCQLALAANPNILEQLFMPDRAIIHMTPWMERLLEVRQAFLSTKVKFSYSGYAIAQLKRIRGHHRWLVNPPKKQPTREDFGIPDNRLIPKDQLDSASALIRKRIESWMLDALDDLDDASREAITQRMEAALEATYAIGYLAVSGKEPVIIPEPNDILFRAAVQELGFSDNFVEYLQRERQYKMALVEWNQYRTWLRDRNPARAALEQKWGFDSKHASHLYRLMRQGEELLTTGQLHVDRTGIDAEELLAIRNNGIYTYDQIVEWAEKMDARLDTLYQDGTSPLPKKPDFNKVEAILVSLQEESLSL